MKKFSKIYETKEKILDVIGVTENELKEVCLDLIDDYDFEFKITAQYISHNGEIYYKPEQTTEYYPSIQISLVRQVTDYHSGNSIISGDVRNWNGGIYYEGDANLIKTIYETIQRMESMLESGDIKVYYAIRSINDIHLRITTPTEETKLPIDVEKIVDFIENGIENLEDLPFKEYEIERTRTSGNKRTIEILPKEKVFHTDITKFKEDVPGDVIISRLLKIGDRNNTGDLAIIANHIIKKVLSVATQKESRKSGLVAEYYDEGPGIGNYDEAYISWNKQKLIKFTASTDNIANGNVITKKGIFKDESVHIEIDKLELKIEILVEKGYGED